MRCQHDSGFSLAPLLKFFSFLSYMLLNLSDNYQNQLQNNTVVVQQEEMDRVEGFEPTTSAYHLLV
jgi:hypothetical protein